MKHLSQTTVYALQAIYELALHDNGDPIPIADVAQRQDIPRRFLEEILRRLREAGLVRSTRGKCGGYALNVRADLLSVGDIVCVFEKEKRCFENLPVGLGEELDQAASAYMESLNLCTIDKLLQRSNELRFVPNYCI